MLGFEPGNALVQFAEDFVAGDDLPGGKLRLVLGKGLKPAGGGDGGGWCVVHEGWIGAAGAARQSDEVRAVGQFEWIQRVGCGGSCQRTLLSPLWVDSGPWGLMRQKRTPKGKGPIVSLGSSG